MSICTYYSSIIVTVVVVVVSVTFITVVSTATAVVTWFYASATGWAGLLLLRVVLFIFTLIITSINITIAP